MHRDKSPAAEFLTSRGLTALGPVPWGSPVSSDGTGVYVVASQELSDVAPIDSAAVAGWINRVATLLVDGRRPTTAELASRLASFWIPSEPVLYIGLAGTSVSKRVRQFYRTPLGDPRPHAGGHWIKTLAKLAALRVWWAETDDPVGDQGMAKLGPRQRRTKRAGEAATERAPCICGCGGTPKAKEARSLPGHGARWHSAQKWAAAKSD